MDRSLDRSPVLAAAVCLLGLLTASSAAAQRVLFDASHGETAGEADWIVDADSSEQYWDTFQCRQGRKHHSGQRFPTPPQSGIVAGTDERFWDGGVSAWAVDLALDALDPARGRTWSIEQYPWDAPPFTFGDPTNPQDLTGYDVLILVEPNVIFTDAEAQAIREFVASGGGLFLVADHETSDRNCSGGPNERHDSPFILNRLMQTGVETRREPPYFDPLDPDNDYGVFGIWFYENDNDNPNDPANRAFDWFTEARNDNVSTDPADPIVHGPFGAGSGGLGFFGATQMAVSSHAEKGNPTARAHLWRNGQDHAANALGVSERVTFASARFGAGRVVAVGDSSPADDGTGEGNLHPGWDKASFGVANDVIFLNATEWLAAAEPDVTPPAITAGPAVAAQDCAAVVSWVTGEPASSRVEWGATTALGEVAEVPGFAIGHSVELTGLEAEREHFFRVASIDPAGNGPVASAVASFTTSAPSPIALIGEPSAVVTGAATAVVAWRTTRPGAGRVHLEGAGEARTVEGAVTGDHAVAVAGLVPATTYRYRVEATDACGRLATSSEQTFTTAATPPSRELSGWRLVNTNAAFELTLPPGTEIPANGFLVVGRQADRAAFEAEWGPLPAGVVYLDSGNSIVINSTGRPYTLLDAAGAVVDGPTVEIRSGRSLARRDGCAAAASAVAWSDRSAAEADPGRGAPAPCGAGVVITEMADASDFRFEFVEIHFDAGGAP